MYKRIFNPVIITMLIAICSFGLIAHIMYSSCQNSKYHFITQCYLMPKYLPVWMLREAGPQLINDIKVHSFYSGKWRSWYENGNIRSEGDYVFGKEEGLYKYWYINGNKKALWNFHNGIVNGQCIDWHTNGVKASVSNFVKGLEVGISKKWYKSGNIHREIMRKSGYVVVLNLWNKDGSVMDKKDYEFEDILILKALDQNVVRSK